MRYTVNDPDYKCSPFTGMTRRHWFDAARFLLEGAFTPVHTIDDPLVTPAYATLSEEEQAHHRYEGIVRTAILAIPLINEKPSLTIRGFSMQTYFSNWFLRLTEPNGKDTALTYEEVRKKRPNAAKYQQTVESAMLCLLLHDAKTTIWEKYDKKEKEQILNFVEPYAISTTGNNNWRFFNVLMLTFLKENGRDIDLDMLKNHLDHLMEFYAGDGWYRDGNYFDYYNAWAFQTYGPLWDEWYGENPYRETIRRNFDAFIKTYPAFFSRTGESILWGRSGIYRFGCTTPFAVAFFEKNPPIAGGLARRIMSGCLLEFLTKEALFQNNIPCLGWFSPFPAIVQSYSCPYSVFWLAKAFLCLSLPADSAFWIDTEQDAWNGIQKRRETYLPGPGILVVNENKSGMTELKSSKYFFPCDPQHLQTVYLGNYARLSFSSSFPYDALSAQVNSQQYTLNGKVIHTIAAVEKTKDVLYRKGFWQFELMRREENIDLADITVDYGTIRIDRLKVHDKPYDLTLGGYSIPVIEGKQAIDKLDDNGHMAIVIRTKDLQTALVALQGWDNVDVQTNHNKNTVSETSMIPYARKSENKQYGKEEFLITVILTKKGEEPFTQEELNPVLNIKSGKTVSEGCTLDLRDGRTISVSFDGIEGMITL
ncbi:MAG: DUF2264 domain-containing protein [Sphaerochaetaceae bacterium]